MKIPEPSLLKYFEYALAGYGAIWALVLFVAFVGQTRIDAGAFGLVGFPIIALFYGIIRGNLDTVKVREINAQLERLTKPSQELEQAVTPKNPVQEAH